MKDGDGCGWIDGDRGRWLLCAGDAQEPLEGLGLVVRLDPGAHREGRAIADGAFEDRLVCNENLGAALGQNAAHLGKREQRVQRNRNASGANNGQKPVEALPIVGAIDSNGLAGSKGNRATQKGIESADFSVQIGKIERVAVLDADCAISAPANQLIHEIGDGHAAVPRESIALKEAHGTATGLRPQSLATQ